MLGPHPLKLFIDAKSTLQSTTWRCKREFPFGALLKLSSYRTISTEDPGSFFRKFGWGGGGPKTAKSTLLQYILPYALKIQKKCTMLKKYRFCSVHLPTLIFTVGFYKFRKFHELAKSKKTLATIASLTEFQATFRRCAR